MAVNVNIRALFPSSSYLTCSALTCQYIGNRSLEWSQNLRSCLWCDRGQSTVGGGARVGMTNIMKYILVWARSRCFWDTIDQKTFWCNLGHVNGKLFPYWLFLYSSRVTIPARLHRVNIPYILSTLNIVVRLLQSKKLIIFLQVLLCWDSEPPPPLIEAHSPAWIASPEDLIHWNYKKSSRLQPSRGQCLFIHWLVAWDGYVSAFISPDAAISVFFHSTECGAASLLSLAGASLVSFLPLSGFISEIVSW